MTTNVRDSLSHVMAADSRWSVPLAPFGLEKILYVDEADYQKIITFGNSVFMFAGLCSSIDAWKYAIALASYSAKSVDWATLPRTGLCISVVEMQTGNVLFEINHPISYPQCSFAGSGADFAVGCWSINRDAIRAVNTAKASDIYSGGVVRYHRHLTGENNFGFDKSLRELIAKFSERGYIVNTATHNDPVPISEAIKQEPILRSVLQQMAQGNISPSAPFDGMEKPWSEDDSKKLVSTMERIFPKS